VENDAFPGWCSSKVRNKSRRTHTRRILEWFFETCVRENVTQGALSKSVLVWRYSQPSLHELPYIRHMALECKNILN